MTWEYLDSAGPIVVNSVYFKYTGTLNAADATTIINAGIGSWGASLGGHMCPNITFVALGLNDLDSRTGVQLAVASGARGTAVVPAVTSGAALVISGKVAYKFRGGHARVYLSGLPLSATSDPNSWSAGTITALGSAWNSHINSITGAATGATGAIQAVMAHRYSKNPAELGEPPTFVTPKPLPIPNPSTFPITSWTVNPQLASQRRRNQQ